MSKITTTEIINGLYSRSGTLGIANQIKMADDNESATISEAISGLSDKILASSVYEAVIYGIEAVYVPFIEYDYSSLIEEWYSANNPSEANKLINQNVWYIDHGSLDYGLTNTINLQVPISASELTDVVHDKSFIIKNSTIAKNQTVGSGNYNVSIDNILGDARFGDSVNINNDYIFLVPSGITTGTWTAKALVGKKYSDILNGISN